MGEGVSLETEIATLTGSRATDDQSRPAATWPTRLRLALLWLTRRRPRRVFHDHREAEALRREHTLSRSLTRANPRYRAW